ncbi:transposase domain-containing protein [Ralstonia pseudosolanacearum]|uniref:transposase domain-containing protein n=1 Tax=Ralstonia pseudosolanacearum TaxID=1310165 RepID=UPI002E2325B7
MRERHPAVRRRAPQLAFCDANASTTLCSLVETAKANGVDAHPYLVALFKALPCAQAVDDDEACCPGASSRQPTD